MSYHPVPLRYKFKCRFCKSDHVEYKEHDENCDINYHCLACGRYWWVDGSDY